MSNALALVSLPPGLQQSLGLVLRPAALTPCLMHWTRCNALDLQMSSNVSCITRCLNLSVGMRPAVACLPAGGGCALRSVMSCIPSDLAIEQRLPMLCIPAKNCISSDVLMTAPS